LVLPVWALRSPDGTKTAPSGVRHAHFEGFFHGEPLEWRVKIDGETRFLD
jgi:hypothetical protein